MKQGTRIFISLIALLTHYSVCAQDFLSVPEVDSSYVGASYSDWSVRAFWMNKYEYITVRNDKATVKYRPADLMSVGLGFSYKSWVVDIGFRLNTNSRASSRRIDLSTSALVGPHLIGIGLQYYKGFEEIRNSLPQPFREDMRTLTMNLDYLYFPNVAKTSYQGMSSGLGFQKKNIGSPLIGGFMERHQVKGDSSLIPANLQPEFETENNIHEMQLRSVGVLFGYAQFLRLSEHWYGAAIVTGGLGGFWGRKDYEHIENEHTAGAMYLFKLYAAIGYNWGRVYSIVNYMLDSHFIGMEGDDRYSYNLGRLKLAIGYKFTRNEG